MIDKIKVFLNKYLLHIAFFVSLTAYSFWSYIKELTGLRVFHPLVALFIVLITYQLHKDNKKSFIRFLIFELATVNLVKELFLNPGELLLGEALMIVIIPVIWCLKNGKHN